MKKIYFALILIPILFNSCERESSTYEDLVEDMKHTTNDNSNDNKKTETYVNFFYDFDSGLKGVTETVYIFGYNSLNERIFNSKEICEYKDKFVVKVPNEVVKVKVRIDFWSEINGKEIEQTQWIAKVFYLTKGLYNDIELNDETLVQKYEP